jgi:hypothetical protein
MTRSEGIVLAAITALALGLRVTKLGTQSFWEDETVTANIVREPFHILLLRVRSLESTPPLYHVTTWAWSKATGVSEIGLRSPGWAISSALAVAAHYFAVFLVFVEAVILIRYVPRQRMYVLALAPTVAVGVALIPLLREQRHNAGFGGAEGIGFRLRQLGTWFATGDLRATPPLVVAALAATIGIWLLVRRPDARPQTNGLIALGVGLATIAIPGVLLAAGLDYFLFRNLIAAWVPLAIGLSIGFMRPGAGWLGVGGAAALCVVFAVADIAVFARTGLQRDDWRSVAGIVAKSRGPTAVVVYPRWDARTMLYYLPSLRTPPGRFIGVRSIWFVGVDETFQGGRAVWTPPDEVQVESPHGFRAASPRRFQHFVVRRFNSRQPLSVSVGRLERSISSSTPVRVLVG